MTEKSYEETVLTKHGETRRFKLYHSEQGQVLEWDMAGGHTMIQRGHINLRRMYEALVLHLLANGWRRLGPLEQLGDAANG